MKEVHITTEQLVAWFEGRAAGLPDGYHALPVWDEINVQVDKVDPARVVPIAAESFAPVPGAGLGPRLGEVPDANDFTVYDLHELPYHDGAVVTRMSTNTLWVFVLTAVEAVESWRVLSAKWHEDAIGRALQEFCS